MTLYVNPGSYFEATFDSVYTGLEGQVRISIINTPTEEVVLAPTTEGIFETDTTVDEFQGIYSWSGHAPPVTGQYTIIWDDGSEPDPEVYAVEDLIVTGQSIEIVSQNQLIGGLLSKGKTHIVDMKDVGPPSTPQEIKRLRRQVGDMLRRYGQPMIHRHMYTLDDFDNGIAKKCPACYDEAYNQTRNDCPVCFSMGFVSVEDSTNRWIDDYGNYSLEDTGTPAPKWGGFAEPSLTLVLQPDVPIDLFKLNERGALTRVEQAHAHTYFTPYFADNDLLIMVKIDEDGYTIKDILDYYQAKNSNQLTIRGWGKRVRDQNQHIISQSFEMAMIPPNNILHKVPPGTVIYED